MGFNPKMNMGAPIGGAGNPVQRPKAQTPPPLPKKTTDPADKALADALDSANRQNTELQEKIQQLTDELEGKEKELRAIQAKLEASPEPAKDDELANAIEARKAAEDVIDRLEREISELKASGNQTANLQKELDEALAALKATTVPKSDDTYDYLIAEREKVEEECQRLQNELNEAQAKCAELQNKLDFEKTDAESVFRLHISKIEELEDKISILESIPDDDEDQDKLVQSLSADLQLKDREIQNLLDEIRRIEDEKSRLNEDIRQLKAVPTTPFPVADHSVCNQKIQDLNQKVQKLNEDLQKAYDRARRLETTIELEQSKWVEAQETKEWAEKTANALHAFLNEIDPEPDGDPEMREERIYNAFKNQERTQVRAAEPSRKMMALIWIATLFVSLICGGVIGYGICAMTGEPATDETASEATSANSAEEPPPVEVPVTVQTPPNANAEPEPSTPPETCYPANPQNILALLNQKSKDATVWGRVQINTPKGAKRIVCQETERAFADGRTNLAGCEICVPYGPGRYPADSKYVSAILGRADASCYDYRARTPYSEWSYNTIHLDCKEKPDYFIPADCRDITGCEIVVPDPKKIACDTCD